jgi:hypothetical protein
MYIFNFKSVIINTFSLLSSLLLKQSVANEQDRQLKTLVDV